MYILFKYFLREHFWSNLSLNAFFVKILPMAKNGRGKRNSKIMLALGPISVHLVLKISNRIDNQNSRVIIGEMNEQWDEFNGR